MPYGNTRGIFVTADVTLVTEECCACGVTFGIPDDLRRELLKDHSRSFYCPNGHGQHYTGKTPEQQLKEAAARETHLKDQLQAATREAELVRVALIRDRHRFANGICPCCNRYFANVHRHMTTEHPDYDITKVEGPEPKPSTSYKCSCGRSFTTPHGLAVHQGKVRKDDWYSAGRRQWHGGHVTVV